MNCRFIFIITSLLFTLTSFAQTTKDKLNYANQLYYSNADSSYIICNGIAEKLKGKNYNELAEAKLCKARYLLLKTSFDKAAKLLNEASDIFKKENNLSRLAKCHSLKSILAGRIFDKENEFYHARKALELYTTAGNIKGQTNVIINMSFNFLDNQQNDSAFLYLLKLKDLKEHLTETDNYFFHQNFALYYYNVGNYPSSLKEYNAALEIATDENMIDSKTSCLKSMATTYIALKKYKTAEIYLKQSLDIAINNKLLHETNEAYSSLVNLYEILGNFQEAFRIEKLNDKIEKEIYNLEKINKINEIEAQLKLTEKENIITQKELEIKNEQLNTVKAKSRISQLVFVVLLSMVIIVFIIIILFRVKKLSNRIQAQKQMLEQKNTEITDSITYAKRIQSAILPSLIDFKKKLPNSFILYKPKDIVAGDFYWMNVVGNDILYATADCTGHGVPGAMVSVVCSNSLNQSVKELKTSQPSKILEMTRKLVKESFSSDIDNVNDGMDISLCTVNLEEKNILFSGANNPIYIIRKNKLIELKGDKQPVGKHYKEQPFSEQKFKLEENDTIYTFTDGYADQFGGPKGKKFMYKQFKELLISIANQPLEKQKEKLAQVFGDWKGDLEQIDDVCVIGVRI